MNQFHKGSVLFTLGRYTEALDVLQRLTLKCPKEAPIHIMIGKIYRKMNQTEKALRHFNISLDLDPQDTNMVKTLIDKID
mmetsp:Transcript_54713/g.75173  ORF Transcript_54713/g.75173 Transcript_54713/m.75173 type:complete len:80 (-) Transcript_54713:81-320(-)